MGDTTLLRVIAYQNPEAVHQARSFIEVASHIDERVLKHIYFRTHSIHTSHDDFTDKISFVAAALILLSPESMGPECKVRNGVRAAISKQMGISPRAVTYYADYARDYYTINPVFRETVDGIVRRYK